MSSLPVGGEPGSIAATAAAPTAVHAEYAPAPFGRISTVFAIYSAGPQGTSISSRYSLRVGSPQLERLLELVGQLVSDVVDPERGHDPRRVALNAQTLEVLVVVLNPRLRDVWVGLGRVLDADSDLAARRPPRRGPRWSAPRGQ